MKLLKYLFFLILIVLIGGAIYFSTKDGKFDVAESKVINAPASVIFKNVNDFKSWQAWGPWMEKDPNIKINYAEKTAGEGASYSWESDHIEVGTGAMQTIKVIPNKEIDQKITFNTPIGDSESDVMWTFEDTETPGQTKVTWAMKGEQSLMEKVFMSFQDEDMETGISEMFTTGLNSLDKVVQKKMSQYALNVDGITQYGGGYYMYNTTAARMNDVSTKMAPLMQQVMSFVQDNNLQMAGSPFTIYNQIDQASGNVIFSAGIPVKAKVITPPGSPVLNGFMEPVTALKTTLKGNYTNLQEAYGKAFEYIAKNNLERHPTAKMFEVYRTDPTSVPNPAEWVTEVYIPIVTPQPDN